ncbi:TonB-dependent receptor plug domain-containing protein [Sphingomonas sp.]|uniref:TonB-dependent receptor plug domain-containing protein n=1 Tax=Sphingomonas sp. TaxID=28214 RepID=UPI0035B06C75
MIRRAAASLTALSGLVAFPPAAAQHIVVDLPAGRLGEVADALGHQTGANIVLADPVLWGRRVPALRGAMTVETAVRRLARAAGAEVARLPGSGWRLALRRNPVARASPPPPPVVAAPELAPAGPDVVVLASKLGTRESRMAGSVEVIASPQVGVEAGTSALVMQSGILSSTYRGPGRDKLFIGGIADSSYTGRLQSVTGQYFGDVRLTYNAPDPNLQLYDIASVEVMQGPQGTLYGSGAMAGIVRLNPVMPKRGKASGTIGAAVSSVAHGGTGGDADAMLNVPLTGNLALRAVGYARSEAGYIDKPALGPEVGREVNRTRIGGGRAILRWWPGDDWTVDGIVMAQTIRARDNADATDDAPPLTSLSQERDPSGTDYGAAHLVATGSIGDATLVSATGVARQHSDERVSTRFFPDLTSDVERRYGMITHETRISRRTDDDLAWVAGIAYSASRSDLDLGLTSSPGLISVGFVTSELAMFGEVAVPVASFLTIGAGVRAARVRSRQDVRVRFDPVFEMRSRKAEEWILPTASVILTPTRRLSLHARYQSGRRAALPDDPFRPTDAAGRRERISSIAAGIRWQPAVGFNADVTVQRDRWEAAFADLADGFIGIGLFPLGDLTVDSMRGSLDWAVTRRLTVSAAGSASRQLHGVLELAAPDRSFIGIARLEGQWSNPVGRTAEMRLNAWMRYQGDPDRNVVLRRQKAYFQTGMAVSLVRGGDALTVSALNVLDTRTDLPLLRNPNDSLATSWPLPPRTVRVEYRRTF